MSSSTHNRIKSRFSRSEESTGFLLWRVSTTWRRKIEGALEPFGLTQPQFVMLAAIGFAKAEDVGLSQAALSRYVGLDPNTTSQILRGLHARRLVSRERTHDERAKTTTLTREAQQLLSHAIVAVENADADFFAPLKSVRPLLAALQALATQ